MTKSPRSLAVHFALARGKAKGAQRARSGPVQRWRGGESRKIGLPPAAATARALPALCSARSAPHDDTNSPTPSPAPGRSAPRSRSPFE